MQALFPRMRAVLAALSLAGVAVSPAVAQSYPVRAVKIVVPYAAGGPADAFARIAAQQLGELWKQPVIVENRAGATGNIGTEIVARAPADGYTLLVGSGSMAISVTLEDKLPYNITRDLVPVTGLASTPYFLFANVDFPANSVRELVTLAREKPDRIAYGSAGNGGTPHLSGEMFNLLADTRLLHVPYKGTGPATTAMLGGEVQLMFGSLTSTNVFVKAKKLKILGAADAKRSVFLPDVPTISEAGVPGFEAANWFGLFAPSGTPPAVVLQIADAVVQTQAIASVKAQMTELGAVPIAGPPREFQAYFDRQVQLWGRVIRERNLRKE
jgi:tripartite-type tricarboxylate transporter receptor subunit TctC